MFWCGCEQSSIEAEGFRSLREGESVEFELEAGEDGRTKAVKVTGPEGAAPQVRGLRHCLTLSRPKSPKMGSRASQQPVPRTPGLTLRSSTLPCRCAAKLCELGQIVFSGF